MYNNQKNTPKQHTQAKTQRQIKPPQLQSKSAKYKSTHQHQRQQNNHKPKTNTKRLTSKQANKYQTTKQHKAQ